MGRKLFGEYGGINPTGPSIAFAPPYGEEQLERFFAGDIKEGERPYFYHGVGRHTPENYALVQKLLEGECGAWKDEYDGITFASGMSAICMTVFSLCVFGKKALIYSSKVYGCTFVSCYEQFPALGIPTYRVDNPADEKAWEIAANQAIADGHAIGAFLAETPSNPLADVFLIRMFAQLPKKFGGVTVVDNTVATHAIQKPFLWGVDVVVSSASKGLNDYSTDLGGILLAKKELFEEMTATKFFHTIRPVMGPKTAVSLLKRLHFFGPNIYRHSENARILAEWLAIQSEFVEKVYYPTLAHSRESEIISDQMNGYGGTLISFGIKGGREKAKAFVDALQFAVVMVHICDCRYTLVNCSGRTSHADMPPELQKAAGITENLIRVSPSAEDEKTFREYLIPDFKQAFEKVFR